MPLATQPGPEQVLQALIPARHGAWFTGDLGRRIANELHVQIVGALDAPNFTLRRVTGGVVIAAEEDAGPFLGALAVALRETERFVVGECPAMRADLGSIFTGAIQVALPDPEFQVAPEPEAWIL